MSLFGVWIHKKGSIIIIIILDMITCYLQPSTYDLLLITYYLLLMLLIHNCETRTFGS